LVSGCRTVTERVFSGKVLPFTHPFGEHFFPIAKEHTGFGMVKKFVFNAVITNTGRTFEAWAKWKHKTNPAFNSQWVRVLPVVIA
jgi:hypothetical protein